MHLSLDTAAISAALARARTGMPEAIARGINGGGDKVRTAVQRALKEQTNVKLYRSITGRVRTQRAHPGALAYVLLVKNKAIPIQEFPLRVTDGGIVAEPWGVQHSFAASFQQRFKGGLMARRDMRTGAIPGRLPIRRLLGPSLGKEALRGATPRAFQDGVVAAVQPAVGAAILRLLGP